MFDFFTFRASNGRIIIRIKCIEDTSQGPDSHKMCNFISAGVYVGYRSATILIVQVVSLEDFYEPGPGIQSKYVQQRSV